MDCMSDASFRQSVKTLKRLQSFACTMFGGTQKPHVLCGTAKGSQMLAHLGQLHYFPVGLGEQGWSLVCAPALLCLH